jgi:hypothetical protein
LGWRPEWGPRCRLCNAENPNRAWKAEALEVVKPFTERAVAWKHNADSARVSVRLADLRAARRFYEKHKGGVDG